MPQGLTRKEKLDNMIEAFLDSPASYTKKFLNVKDINYIKVNYSNLAVETTQKMNSRQQLLCKISKS